MQFNHPRILITRLSALGDCVHSMPLASALRRHIPGAHITWLTQAESLPLLNGHSAVDEFITVKRGYLRSPSQVGQLRKQLLAREFDITIDPQSLTKSAAPAWLSGAKMRIGFAAPDGREAAPWLNNTLVKPEHSHVIDRNMELLAPLGIRHADVEFQYPLHKSSLAHIDDVLHERVASVDPIVMHPGAGWKSKLWPHMRYAEVAAYLGRRWRIPSVIAWAGDKMRGWVEQIVARAGGHAIAAPALTLPELAALLSRTRLFVGSDSGPLHIAAALDVPTVSMYGPTLPDRNGPYRQGHTALQVRFQSGTTRQRKRAGNDAMREITSGMVIDMCEQVLDVRTPAIRREHVTSQAVDAALSNTELVDA